MWQVFQIFEKGITAKTTTPPLPLTKVEKTVVTVMQSIGDTVLLAILGSTMLLFAVLQ